MDDFLSYLDKWEAQVNARADVPSEAKQTMLLSAETMEGLRITGMFFLFCCDPFDIMSS